MKKLFMLSLIICLAMLMTVSCSKNKDIEEESGNLSYYVNPDGKTCTVTGIGNFEGNNLVIDTIDGYAVTKIQARAFFGCESIKKVTIGDSVTQIGELAFAICNNLESVKLPSVLKDTGNSVFYGCSALVSVKFPSELEQIGDATFAFCSKLTEINIPDGVKRIGKLAFADCVSLNKLTIPESVSEIDWYAFDGCKSLKGVYISDIAAWSKINFSTDTANPLYYAKKLYLNDKLVRELAFSSQINSNVKKIGDRAFINCEDIGTVILGDSGLTSIGAYAFAGTGISAILIPNTVEFIAVGALKDCNRLEQIKYDGKKANWKNIYYGGELTDVEISCIDGYVDEETPNTSSQGLEYKINEDNATCTIVGIGTNNSTQIVIGEHINGYKVTAIGDSAFADCTEITHITLPDSVTAISFMAFKGCTSLQTIKIPDNVKIIDSYAFQDCVSLKSVELPKSLEIIQEYAFYNCSALESIEIPEGTTRIYDNAFESCLSLEAISIPKSVEYIRWGAFLKCENLQTVKFDGSTADWENIDKGDKCFEYATQAILYCTDGQYSLDENGELKGELTPPPQPIPPASQGYSKGLEYIYVANSNTYKVNGIGNCVDKYLKISSKYYDSDVIGINDYAFFDNSDIKGVEFEEGIEYIGQSAFYSCGAITEIVFPESLLAINEDAFHGCAGIRQIVIPGKTDIQKYAFTSCKQVISVEMQNVVSVDQSAFSSCHNLISVKLGPSLENIGQSAFSGSDKLESIYYDGTYEMWEKIVKGKNCFMPSYADGYNPVLICNDGMYSIDYNGEILEKIEPDQEIYSTGFTYKKNEDGETCTITGLGSCKDTELVIGGSIDGYKITAIADNAFKGRTSLTSLVISDGITYIGKSAFESCAGLVSVEIADSVEEMGAYVFLSCSNLKKVKLSSGMQSIPKYAFESCKDLERISIPQGITHIAVNAFDKCTALQYVYIPASVVEIADSAYARCLAIKTVEFGGEMDEWHSIKKMGNFNGGVDLTIECSDGDITIRSNFVYQTSSSGGLAIYGLGSSNSQNNITIPAEYNGKVVDEIASLAFNGKLNIVSVVIPDTVTKIGDKAFSYCSRLQSVEFQGSSCVLGNDIFEGCNSLSSIIFHGTMEEWDSLQKSGDWNPNRIIVVYCSDGEVINDHNGENMTGIVNTPDDLIYSVSGDDLEITGIIDSSISEVVLYDHYNDGNGNISSVRKIGDRAFENNTYIKNVTITGQINEIGDNAFAGCSNLETIVLLGTNMTIGISAFEDCENLTCITFYGTVVEWNNISKGIRWRNRVGHFVVECTDGQVKYD